ncbi:TetR/AcrR family transcriptional regulator [Salinarimonas ramus]|uniref:TetR family transcriptional regulator n=1 Tax=Salinarimonas ramus TaxID=690164 RepID=A0A917V1S7_9HYPH|nr:TetR/AcrR family transcriptional regulator [Salinarimonas ramus]GGK22164.1 TetR family transcriptional regulator [Salinarimonas ramus]
MIESRQAIVERSNDLFYEAGFVGVSIEAVLDASGLSRGTFYKHFSGKHDVALAVLEYRGTKFEGALAEALADAADTRAVAVALFRVLREWQRRHGARGCLFQTAASEYGRRHADVFRLASDHKIRVRGLVEVALHRAGATDYRRAADELLLLFEGAVALGQFHDHERQIDAAERAAAALLA